MIPVPPGDSGAPAGKCGVKVKLSLKGVPRPAPKPTPEPEPAVHPNRRIVKAKRRDDGKAVVPTAPAPPVVPAYVNPLRNRLGPFGVVRSTAPKSSSPKSRSPVAPTSLTKHRPAATGTGTAPFDPWAYDPIDAGINEVDAFINKSQSPASKNNSPCVMVPQETVAVVTPAAAAAAAAAPADGGKGLFAQKKVFSLSMKNKQPTAAESTGPSFTASPAPATMVAPGSTPPQLAPADTPAAPMSPTEKALKSGSSAKKRKEGAAPGIAGVTVDEEVASLLGDDAALFAAELNLRETGVDNSEFMNSKDVCGFFTGLDLGVNTDGLLSSGFGGPPSDNGTEDGRIIYSDSDIEFSCDSEVGSHSWEGEEGEVMSSGTPDAGDDAFPAAADVQTFPLGSQSPVNAAHDPWEAIPRPQALFQGETVPPSPAFPAAGAGANCWGAAPQTQASLATAAPGSPFTAGNTFGTVQAFSLGVTAAPPPAAAPAAGNPWGAVSQSPLLIPHPCVFPGQLPISTDVQDEAMAEEAEENAAAVAAPAAGPWATAGAAYAATVPPSDDEELSDVTAGDEDMVEGAEEEEEEEGEANSAAAAAPAATPMDLAPSGGPLTGSEVIDLMEIYMEDSAPESEEEEGECGAVLMAGASALPAFAAPAAPAVTDEKEEMEEEEEEKEEEEEEKEEETKEDGTAAVWAEFAALEVEGGGDGSAHAAPAEEMPCVALEEAEAPAAMVEINPFYVPLPDDSDVEKEDPAAAPVAPAEPAVTVAFPELSSCLPLSLEAPRLVVEELAPVKEALALEIQPEEVPSGDAVLSLAAAVPNPALLLPEPPLAEQTLPKMEETVDATPVAVAEEAETSPKASSPAPTATVAPKPAASAAAAVQPSLGGAPKLASTQWRMRSDAEKQAAALRILGRRTLPAPRRPPGYVEKKPAARRPAVETTTTRLPAFRTTSAPPSKPWTPNSTVSAARQFHAAAAAAAAVKADSLPAPAPPTSVYTNTTFSLSSSFSSSSSTRGFVARLPVAAARAPLAPPTVPAPPIPTLPLTGSTEFVCDGVEYEQVPMQVPYPLGGWIDTPEFHEFTAAMAKAKAAAVEAAPSVGPLVAPPSAAEAAVIAPAKREEVVEAPAVAEAAAADAPAETAAEPPLLDSEDSEETVVAIAEVPVAGEEFLEEVEEAGAAEATPEAAAPAVPAAQAAAPAVEPLPPIDDSVDLCERLTFIMDDFQARFEVHRQMEAVAANAADASRAQAHLEAAILDMQLGVKEVAAAFHSSELKRFRRYCAKRRAAAAAGLQLGPPFAPRRISAALTMSLELCDDMNGYLVDLKPAVAATPAAAPAAAPLAEPQPPASPAATLATGTSSSTAGEDSDCELEGLMNDTWFGGGTEFGIAPVAVHSPGDEPQSKERPGFVARCLRAVGLGW